VVRLLDAFAERPAVLVIVWELIEGPDLLELLNEGGGCLPEPAAAFFFVQARACALPPPQQQQQQQERGARAAHPRPLHG
jgi:hypothetical protein